MHKCAVFLDRDGTINLDKGYVHRIEDWEWIPWAINAIVALKKAGYLVVIITNQAGIARVLYGETDMIALHILVNEQLKLYGVEIDGFFHCPHHPEFFEIRECECRKPKPGMIIDASKEFNLSGFNSPPLVVKYVKLFLKPDTPLLAAGSLH